MSKAIRSLPRQRESAAAFAALEEGDALEGCVWPPFVRIVAPMAFVIILLLKAIF
jgi:hypothetical protein